MTVGIVGLGLIGGSFAKAYHAAGWTVYGYDVDESMLAFAQLADAVNAPMWSELFLENRDNMLHELDCLMDRLMEYRAAIAEDDAAALTQLLEDGKKRKEEVDGR